MKQSEFTCLCAWCQETRSLSKKWETYIPTNYVQLRAIDIVMKIEKQATLKRKKRS